jgi:hypothetical protein
MQIKMVAFIIWPDRFFSANLSGVSFIRISSEFLTVVIEQASNIGFMGEGA